MMSRWAMATVALAMATAGFAMAATSPVTGPAPTTTVERPVQSPTAAPAPPLETHALTASDLDAFLDGYMPYAIARGDIAGSVFVVVKNGKILFAKGYGYSDVAKRAPVIPDQTLFRPGSISKPFTWTAVMQLVQAGKIDLDRDVNDYLDFKIPEKFGAPITMRNLMTHTGGFEEGIAKEFVQKPNELFPLRDYLMQHMPKRIYPPGKIVAYSNYGCSLAGYIVQRLSGEPYADYIAHHIFVPLGMAHSTFVQPLPRALAPDMSNGYKQASDKKTIPFEDVETAPAGALSSTGTDMARFMIAHLEHGSYNGASILAPATVELMHSPQSRMAPGVNGFDLGFYQESRNGLRIIGHAGDTEAFHSDLHLLLDKGVGVFMSFNSQGKDGEADSLRTQLFRAFLDRYFPYAPPAEKTVADPKTDAARVAGWYASSRRIDSALRLLGGISQSQVSAESDGTIKIDVLKDAAGNPKAWREVGPLVWREVGGQTHTRFVTDKDGSVSFWISDDFLPVLIFQRVHGLEQSLDFKILMGALAAVLLFTVAIWIGGAIARYRFSRPLALPPFAARLRLASRLGVLTLIAMLAGWGVLFAQLSDASAHLDTTLMALYVVSALAAIGAIVVVVEAALRVLRGPGGWLVRAGEAVLGVLALYALWAICVYGLANFSMTY